MKRIIVPALVLTALLTVPAEARSRSSCDGIHRCRCGSTQAAYFGLPRMYRGFNLWLARDWPRAFPRTRAHAGAVGYQPGHVFRYIRPGSRPGRAIVSDDKGTYERNIRGAIFVSVRGAYASATSQ